MILSRKHLRLVLRLALVSVLLGAGSCTAHLWASTSETKTFFGEAELVAFDPGTKGKRQIEFRLVEVDPVIAASLPQGRPALELQLSDAMSQWVQDRLQSAAGKRSPILTTWRSIELSSSTGGKEAPHQQAKLKLVGSVPPLAEVLVPEGLDYGQPGQMDPRLLALVGDLQLHGPTRWARYAPVDSEGRALSWVDVSQQSASLTGGLALLVSTWNGSAWVHSRIPEGLIGVEPRPWLKLKSNGEISWSWSMSGQILESKPLESKRRDEVSEAARVPLDPTADLRVSYRGRVGVGPLGVLWRIPATPVTMVADILMIPALLVMGTSSLLGYRF